MHDMDMLISSRVSEAPYIDIGAAIALEVESRK
jgi:hypothetical protein